MMESNVPFDTSAPEVRDYLSLVRLQVLTPLSLLVNIATIVICSIVISPSLDEISQQFPTSITPKSWMIALYIVAIWVAQIGYCIMLVLARKPETKQTLIHGSGQWIVWANWVLAAWAVAFLLQGFLVATVFLGITLLLLLFSNITLLTIYPPNTSRPLDTGLIHAPVRLFFILPFMLLFAQSLFITMGHYWTPGRPQDYAHHQWEGFGVVLGTNFVGLIIVIFRRDIVWCLGATWLSASLVAQRPKPFPVYVTALIFAIAHPLALVASYLLLRLRHPQALEATKPGEHHDGEGRIALPPDEDTGPTLAGGPSHHTQWHNQQAQGQAQQAPREVDAEAVWG